MNIKELARLVLDMRRAQNRYFRHRLPKDLEESKQREKAVDKACREILEESEQTPLVSGEE